MKKIFLAASLMLLTGSLRAEMQYTCHAQCVYLDEKTLTVDFGYAVDGFSLYSIGEAYIDMRRNCKTPYQVVRAMAGRVNQVNENENYSHSSSSGYSSAANAQYLSIDKLKAHKISGLRYASASVSASGYSKSSETYVYVRTEKDFEYDLKFASPSDPMTCTSADVDPNLPRKYSGSGEPLGG